MHHTRAELPGPLSPSNTHIHTHTHMQMIVLFIVVFQLRNKTSYTFGEGTYSMVRDVTKFNDELHARHAHQLHSRSSHTDVLPLRARCQRILVSGRWCFPSCHLP